MICSRDHRDDLAAPGLPAWLSCTKAPLSSTVKSCGHHTGAFQWQTNSRFHHSNAPCVCCSFTFGMHYSVCYEKKRAISCVLWHVFHSHLNRSKWVWKPPLIIHFTTWLGLGVIKWNINSFMDNVYMCVISLETSIILCFRERQLTISKFWPLGLDFSKDGQLFLRTSPNSELFSF